MDTKNLGPQSIINQFLAGFESLKMAARTIGCTEQSILNWKRRASSPHFKFYKRMLAWVTNPQPLARAILRLAWDRQDGIIDLEPADYRKAVDALFTALAPTVEDATPTVCDLYDEVTKEAS